MVPRLFRFAGTRKGVRGRVCNVCSSVVLLTLFFLTVVFTIVASVVPVQASSVRAVMVRFALRKPHFLS